MSYNYGGGYGHDQYNNNNNMAPSGFQPQGGFGAPPPGPAYGGGYDQNNQGGFNPNPSYGAPQQQYGTPSYGQQGGQASSYYGDQAPGASTGTNYGTSTTSSFSGSREMSDQSNEDLPYPWYVLLVDGLGFYQSATLPIQPILANHKYDANAQGARVGRAVQADLLRQPHYHSSFHVVDAPRNGPGPGAP